MSGPSDLARIAALELEAAERDLTAANTAGEGSYLERAVAHALVGLLAATLRISGSPAAGKPKAGTGG